jgi:hypothetical protein
VSALAHTYVRSSPCQGRKSSSSGGGSGGGGGGGSSGGSNIAAYLHRDVGVAVPVDTVCARRSAIRYDAAKLP